MKPSFNEFKEYIKNKKVAVVGIGISNIPLINFLYELGAKITAFDKKSEEQLGDIVKEFKNKGIKMSLGEDYLERLHGFEVIFKTPSMRIDSKELILAKEEGAYITSEMEEFVKYCRGKIYGITGSDGKTTTTTIVYTLLKEAGFKTWVGGNIGTPLFSHIEDISENDKVVLELSSFQLMTMKVSPEIAVVTNLSPNHLDMHKNMEEYVEAKKNIFYYQNNKDVLILNNDNDITKGFIKEAKGKVKLFSVKEENVEAYYNDGYLIVKGQKVCKKEDMLIKGMHNVENMLAAFCAVSEDVSVDIMKKVATTFKGVSHRCELVREVEGVKYYNDSIATSPTRALASLRAFEKKVILIAGGYDKNLPFEPLAREGHEYIKHLIVLGATKEKIVQEFKKLKEDTGINVNITEVSTLEEAVKKAHVIAENNDIVTLSPACASFDMYKNFEIRGNKFKDLVNAL